MLESNLPCVKINVDEVCAFAKAAIGHPGPPIILKDRNAGIYPVVCMAVALEWDEVVHEAKIRDINIDRLLTAQICEHVAIRRYKSKMLIWYGAVSGMVILWFCSKKGRLNLPQFMGICEIGSSDWLHPAASPFWYYDGENIHRVHYYPSIFQSDENDEDDAFEEESEEEEDASLCVTDCGAAMLPYRVMALEEWRYEQIRQNPLDGGNIAYSIVPTESKDTIIWGSRKLTFYHAFCDFFSPTNQR